MTESPTTATVMIIPKRIPLIIIAAFWVVYSAHTSQTNLSSFFYVETNAGGLLSSSRYLQQETAGEKTPPSSLEFENQQRIQQWRQKYSQQCQDSYSTKEDLMKTLASMFLPASPTTTKTAVLAATFAQTTTKEQQQEQQQEKLRPCKYTILDFGANVGDSLGKLIDSRIVDLCPAKGFSKHPKLNLETLQYGNSSFHEKPNALVKTSRSILEQLGRYPEEYCYVGVEGNPHFTQRLQALEARVVAYHNADTDTANSSGEQRNRPLRSVHFLTETVGAGENGPTTLYLDTVNAKHNFWGSSILETHQDVQKSVIVTQDAGDTSTTTNHQPPLPLAAPVQGITLSTLLEKTVLPEKGSHVMIKMDIEGGEYSVLEEAYQSGSLCSLTKAGVIVHLLLETHRPDVLGMKDFDLQHWRHVKNTLTDCGVVLQKGRDAGR